MSSSRRAALIAAASLVAAPVEAQGVRGDDRPGADVLVLGDSFSIGLGTALFRRFAGNPSVDSRGIINTGLSLASHPIQGFTNWLDRAEALMRRPAARRHRVVVVCIGAVDNRWMTFDDGRPNAPFGTPEFAEGYAQRMLRLVDILRQHNARVIWTGLPVAREPYFDQAYSRLEPLGARVAAQGRFTHLPLRPLTSANGAYSETWFDGGHHRVPVRQADGVHFNDEGNHLLTGHMLPLFDAALGRRLPRR
jgi:hypothetical protein